MGPEGRCEGVEGSRTGVLAEYLNSEGFRFGIQALPDWTSSCYQGKNAGRLAQEMATLSVPSWPQRRQGVSETRFEKPPPRAPPRKEGKEATGKGPSP